MAEIPDSVALRRHAMDLLARREHSRQELTEKLQRYCGQVQRRRSRRSEARSELNDEQDGGAETEVDASPRGQREPGVVGALIEATVTALAEEGLQSDSRYGEMLVRSRVNRGQGPLRIRADLRQRGLEGEAVQALLDDYDEHWPQLARQVIERRFGSDAAGDRREWARRARFLASRGFPEGLAVSVLGPLP